MCRVSKFLNEKKKSSHFPTDNQVDAEMPKTSMGIHLKDILQIMLPAIKGYQRTIKG
jgi:hypothetical protein